MKPRRRRRPPLAAHLILSLGVTAALVGSLRCQLADYREVDLHALAAFDLDPLTGTIANVPARWRALDGRRVVLGGLCYAPETDAQGRVTFQLMVMPDPFRPPRVQQRVFVTAPAGRAFDFREPRAWYGVFHVQVRHDPSDGSVT